MCPNAPKHICFRVGRSGLASPGPLSSDQLSVMHLQGGKFRRWETLHRATSHGRPERPHDRAVRGCLCHRALDILTHLLCTLPVPHRRPTTSPAVFPRSSRCPGWNSWLSPGDCQLAGGADRPVLSPMSHASQGSPAREVDEGSGPRVHAPVP